MLEATIIKQIYSHDNNQFLFPKIISSEYHCREAVVAQSTKLIMQKWKIFMLDLLDSMASKETSHKNLLGDLKIIVSKVNESCFIQATLEIQPFKPHFQEQKTGTSISVTESTIAETIAKVARFQGPAGKKVFGLEQKQRITEQTLKNHFNKEYHPYRSIFKNFGRLLELKYKQIIEGKRVKIDRIQDMLREDLRVFEQFFIDSSKPYRKLFKLEANEDEERCKNLLKKFMQGYLKQHSKLNNSLHKIMLYATRSQFG